MGPSTVQFAEGICDRGRPTGDSAICDWLATGGWIIQLECNIARERLDACDAWDRG